MVISFTSNLSLLVRIPLIVLLSLRLVLIKVKSQSWPTIVIQQPEWKLHAVTSVDDAKFITYFTQLMSLDFQYRYACAFPFNKKLDQIYFSHDTFFKKTICFFQNERSQLKRCSSLVLKRSVLFSSAYKLKFQVSTYLFHSG